MEALNARRPGHDGGRRARRFERVGMPQELAQLDPDSLKKLYKNLLALLVMKTRYPNKSESMVADELAFLACLYRQEGRYVMADACPKNYKEMLMVLETTRTAYWDEEVYYEQCPCGLVYRNCSRGDFRSADVCPDCGTIR
jgi:DNA-directed RNA polymerase subunit F